MHYSIPGIPTPEFIKAENRIITAVCRHFGTNFEKIIQRTRRMEICYKRQVLCYMLAVYSEMSLKAIGELLGGFDHTSVLNNRQRIIGLMTYDNKVINDVQKIVELAYLSSVGKCENTVGNSSVKAA